jgi:hypothetical protein
LTEKLIILNQLFRKMRKIIFFEIISFSGFSSQISDSTPLSEWGQKSSSGGKKCQPKQLSAKTGANQNWCHPKLLPAQTAASQNSCLSEVC